MLDHISALDLSYLVKGRMISETRRLWAYRDIHTEVLRLPERQPWLGELARDLFAEPQRRSQESHTQDRSETLVPLLGWAMRFVDDFSGRCQRILS